MTNFFYTSDLHFSHKNIIAYTNRPYDSVEEMNECLVQNWNSVVDKDGYVRILGDVCMGKRDETLPILARLNGHKSLVCGNHDRCWEGDPKHEKWLPKYAEYFTNITQGPQNVAGLFHKKSVYYRVNHFPSEGDSQDSDRYTEYRPVDNGRLLLCGHVHDAWKSKGNNVNVGIDAGWSNGYAPVPVDEVYEYAKEQGIEF